MSSAPALLRYGDVIRLLVAADVSQATARTLIEDETIKPVRLPGRSWAYYSRAQIQRDVLDKLNQTSAEGPASAANNGKHQAP